MFLSHAVAPVLTFTVLLNFFYLYSPISSQTAPPSEEFTTCEDCLKSECYKDKQGTCGVGSDPPYFCFRCTNLTSDQPMFPMFPSEEKCKADCELDKNECICDGPCISCVVSAGLDKTAFDCTMPKEMVDDTCAKIPYSP